MNMAANELRQLAKGWCSATYVWQTGKEARDAVIKGSGAIVARQMRRRLCPSVEHVKVGGELNQITIVRYFFFTEEDFEVFLGLIIKYINLTKEVNGGKQ